MEVKMQIHISTVSIFNYNQEIGKDEFIFDKTRTNFNYSVSLNYGALSIWLNIASYSCIIW